MDNLPSVAVIMSAYNAEEYIKDQVDSILHQKDVNVRLWIRDDGSTDNTLEILRKWYADDQRVTIQSGPNLGARESFFEALFGCEYECDWYGFSDADDVWVPEKLRHSIEFLSGCSAAVPAAVVTRLEVVDRHLNHKGYTASPRKGLIFNNALVETVASGASMLINPEAYSAIRHYRPKFAVMHDSWIYLVLTAFGNMVYSEFPTIRYRQHATNVYGTGHSFAKKVKLRFARMKSVSPFRKQAVEFYREFSDRLEEHKRVALKRYIGYTDSLHSRIAFAAVPTVCKQTRKAEIFMRILIFLGKE